MYILLKHYHIFCFWKFNFHYFYFRFLNPNCSIRSESPVTHQKKFQPFTVRINCSKGLRFFFKLLALNLKISYNGFSLTLSQNNFEYLQNLISTLQFLNTIIPVFHLKNEIFHSQKIFFSHIRISQQQNTMFICQKSLF